ncbi:transcriptional activator spt7 [Anaeramoeba flamelloides]|uniref:Transcriptional activator spt7 n=1 Tax=Anaeramoeba flamelloides TaxID=1746091 RepID=A0ABQ8XGA5_9EUKA|nr:transcriptional activator spt7 [Anaeramoeba flamelloides]
MKRLYETSKSTFKDDTFLKTLTNKEKGVLTKALESEQNFEELYEKRKEDETAKYLFYHLRTYTSRQVSGQLLYNNLQNQGRYYLLHSDPPLNEELIEEEKLKLQTNDNSLLSFTNDNSLNYETFGDTVNYLELDNLESIGELDSMSVGLDSNMMPEESTNLTSNLNSLDSINTNLNNSNLDLNTNTLNPNPNTNVNPNSNTNMNPNTSTLNTSQDVNMGLNKNSNPLPNGNTTNPNSLQNTGINYQLYRIPFYINQSELIWVNHPNQIVKQLYTALWNAFVEISNYDPHFYIFIEKVTNLIAPGYDLVIKKPMYLKKIESKLKNLKYESKKKFSSDFNLMIQNCRTYNTHPDSKPFLVNALEMESKMNQLLLSVPNLKIEKGFLRFNQLGMNSGVFSKMTPKEIFGFEKSLRKLESNMEDVTSNDVSEKIISSIIKESYEDQDTNEEKKEEKEKGDEKEKEMEEEMGSDNERKKQTVSDRIDETMLKIEKENRLKEKLFLAVQLSLKFEEQEAITENTNRKKYLIQGPLQFQPPLPRLFKHDLFDYKQFDINIKRNKELEKQSIINSQNQNQIQIQNQIQNQNPNVNLNQNTNQTPNVNVNVNVNINNNTNLYENQNVNQPNNQIKMEIETETVTETETETETEKGKELINGNEIKLEDLSLNSLKLIANKDVCEEEKEMEESWKAGVLKFLKASGYEKANSIAFLLLADHSLNFLKDFISNMNMLKERNQLNSLNIDPLTLAIQCLSSVNTERSDLKRFSEEETIIKKK